MLLPNIQNSAETHQMLKANEFPVDADQRIELLPENMGRGGVESRSQLPEAGKSVHTRSLIGGLHLGCITPTLYL